MKDYRNKLLEILKHRPENTPVNLGYIHVITPEEIDFYQEGYRVNGLTGEKIEDWFGDEYYVIACQEDALGDPIIINLENGEIYFMFHDDWDSASLIAKSYEEFCAILADLQKVDLNDKAQAEEFIEKITKQCPDYSGFWETVAEYYED